MLLDFDFSLLDINQCSDNMDIQEALDKVGGMKRWHIFAFILLGFTSNIQYTIQIYGIVFIGIFSLSTLLLFYYCLMYYFVKLHI